MAANSKEHPDLCPTCRAPISPEQRKRMEELVRCTCPVGFGAIADFNCPRHAPTAQHTISGLNGRNI